MKSIINPKPWIICRKLDVELQNLKISAKEGRYEREIKDGIKIVLKSCNIILVKWTIVLTPASHH